MHGFFSPIHVCPMASFVTRSAQTGFHSTVFPHSYCKSIFSECCGRAFAQKTVVTCGNCKSHTTTKAFPTYGLIPPSVEILFSFFFFFFFFTELAQEQGQFRIVVPMSVCVFKCVCFTSHLIFDYAQMVRASVCCP